MYNQNTPEKICSSRKSRKESINQYCRCCHVSLKVQYGDTWKSVSTENLFLPSKQRGIEVKALSCLLEIVGISPEKTPDFSERLCKPCATKIRKTSEGFAYLKKTINAENPKCGHDKENLPTTPDRKRTKRTLPTTITPERRQNARKINKINSNDKRNDDALFNIDDLIESDSNKTRVKVLILWPNGDTSVRIPSEEESNSILLIKNIALKNWKPVARTIFKHEDLKPELLDAIWQAMDAEFKGYCSSDTVLKGTKPEELIAFSNNVFLREIAVRCPIWNVCIKGACGIPVASVPDAFSRNSIALASSVAARVRNKSLSALAYRISSIIFHSGTSHQDIIRLNRMGVCMSPDMILGLQRSLGENFDAKVLCWKKELEEKQPDLEMLALLHEVQEKQLPKLEEDDMDLDVSLDITEETLKEYVHYNQEASSNLIQVMKAAKKRSNVHEFTDEAINVAMKKYSTGSRYPFYKLVGDNIDHQIYARIQSKDQNNQSIHWTHQYAIRDSVVDPLLNITKPQKKIEELQLIDLLPTPDVKCRLKHSLKVLVSRVVTKYITAFKSLRRVVVHHIPHPYTKEATQKSEICCLGMEFLNPNIAGEMAQLLMSNQNKYVPQPGGEAGQVSAQIPFHGDQLFEERARHVKWTFQDADCDVDRFEGLKPEFADWHAKVTLYQMEYEMFYKPDSCAELGTSKASMNRTRKTNAAPGPKKKYNEYKDFHNCEVEAHICASFMTMAGMSKLDDKPSFSLPDSTANNQTKGKWLLDICESFIDKYMFDVGDTDCLVQQTHQLQLASLGNYKCRIEGCDKVYVYHSARVSHELTAHGKKDERQGQLRDEYGYYYCRCDCGNVFSTKSTRNRHEKKIHPDFIVPVEETTESTPKVPSDYLYNYHCEKLKFGLILLEFNDAVQEGDGQRLNDLYKLSLLLYKSGGHYKYAYVVLLYLVNISALYTEFGAFQLKWNRFYNKYGLLGRSISLDLKKEQQNKILKSLWRALGPNLNQDNASRVAKTLELLELLIHSVDSDCELLERQGKRSDGNPEEPVLQITSDLMEIKAFHLMPGREGHQSFPQFPSSLIKLDYRDLHKWMTEKIQLWGSIHDRVHVSH